MKINVSLDAWKKICSERRNENETESEIVDRLLGISTTVENRPRAWRSKDGAELEPGTKLRMRYLGQDIEAEIGLDGLWHAADKTFTTPSGAAEGLARTRTGAKPSLDGWEFWRFQRPGEREWTSLKELRQTPAKRLPRRAA